jgi:hypothetical protein
MDIVFNNIQRQIPLCGGKKSCEISQFYSWHEKWNVQDPNRICGIEDPFEIELQKYEDNQVRLYAAIFILSIITVILCIWIWKLKRKGNE